MPRRSLPSASSLRTALRAAVVLAPAALLAACASNSNVPPEQVNVTPSTMRLETADGSAIEARTISEDRAVTRTLDVKPEVAWAKLPAVYGELGLPVNTYVDQTRQIAVKGARFRSRLGKQRLSEFVSCGSDVTGEDRANSYEVTLDVATTVGPAPEGKTHVMSMVTANARPLATSGDPIRCVTTGALEKRIATAVLLKSATP